MLRAFGKEGGGCCDDWARVGGPKKFLGPPVAFSAGGPKNLNGLEGLYRLKFKIQPAPCTAACVAAWAGCAAAV